MRCPPYTFNLPIRVGSGDEADTIHRKVEAIFDLIPDPKFPMLNVIEARIVEGTDIDESFMTLLELVQDYLDDGGYDAARAFAESQCHGGWE